jgi:hypothetical protein
LSLTNIKTVESLVQSLVNGTIKHQIDLFEWVVQSGSRVSPDLIIATLKASRERQLPINFHRRFDANVVGTVDFVVPTTYHELDVEIMRTSFGVIAYIKVMDLPPSYSSKPQVTGADPNSTVGILCCSREQRDFAPVCVVCGNNTVGKKCGRCRNINYCGSKCQKEDWATHKSACHKPEKKCVLLHCFQKLEI